MAAAPTIGGVGVRVSADPRYTSDHCRHKFRSRTSRSTGTCHSPRWRKYPSGRNTAGTRSGKSWAWDWVGTVHRRQPNRLGSEADSWEHRAGSNRRLSLDLRPKGSCHPCLKRSCRPCLKRSCRPCLKRSCRPCLKRSCRPCLKRSCHPCLKRSCHPCLKRSCHPCLKCSCHPCLKCSCHPCLKCSHHPHLHCSHHPRRTHSTLLRLECGPRRRHRPAADPGRPFEAPPELTGLPSSPSA